MGANVGRGCPWLKRSQSPKIAKNPPIKLLQRKWRYPIFFVILNTGGQIVDWHGDPSRCWGNMI
jgi:hypothetical protein